MAGWEAGVTVAFGALTATLIVALALTGVALSVGRAPPTVDVPLYLGLVLLCALLGLGATLVPAWVTLRASPVHAIGGRE